MYKGIGADYGIASGLSDDSAMKAFKDLTDFFTSYKLPYPIDFVNRFRTGEIVIGISDYMDYAKLELIAPEINGLWSFAPIPGTVKNGILDNTVTCQTKQCVMLRQVEKKGMTDEAWTFMTWWMSTEVQVEYANAIESALGASARYATSNKEVLTQLPWSTADAEKLLEQFEHTKGIPAVPGNYMQSRMVDFTFRNVLAIGDNPRESLYLNIKTINAELSKKRGEFGLSVAH